MPLLYLIYVITWILHELWWSFDHDSMMAPRSTPPPKGSFYSQIDNATYRDLLLFEERLKTNAASLQKRKSRYQCAILGF